ncbi:MAG: HlyD family efflux transporter periplasmic adaptor subunit [Clostridia bacterium]|nr:HlyD family efflux transporter periplasmic adaptor subunit [Clostridia bacterium]
MKIRISKKTRRILVLYLAVLVLLYIVIFQMPKMSDKFETTQVLENGTLEVSCEAEGYIVKDEAICVCSKTGTISYRVEDGTVVKKETKIESIEETDSEKESEIKGKYQKLLDQLKGYDLLMQSSTAPISGVFSMSMDGNEKYFRIDNLDKIKKETVEDLSMKQVDLQREKVNQGEPVFKISNDDAWYIVTWVEKADARKYEEGEKVRITIGDSTLDAKVRTIKRDGEFFKMVFYLNVYYEDFCSARKVDMTVVQSNTMGVIVDNECIIEKHGQKGVYVKTKDGDTYFRPIKVKITDGKQSVIYESIYVNDKYEQVETVRVYQEVLRHPQEALEEDLADE